MRYVLNTWTRTIHSADCPHAGLRIVPWPRLYMVGNRPCMECLDNCFPPIRCKGKPKRLTEKYR